MDRDLRAANNAIENDTLTVTERDFINILPEHLRAGALSAYKEYRKISVFGSVFEKAKMGSAWMSGFVTAVFFVKREEEQVTPEIPGA